MHAYDKYLVEIRIRFNDVDDKCVKYVFTVGVLQDPGSTCHSDVQSATLCLSRLLRPVSTGVERHGRQSVPTADEDDLAERRRR